MKNNTVESKLLNILSNEKPFSLCTLKQKKQIIHKMELLDLEPQTLYKKSDLAKYFYIVEYGELELHCGPVQTFAQVGECFGYEAFESRSARRDGKCIIREEVSLWRLNVEDY